jgi:hypothetical protein
MSDGVSEAAAHQMAWATFPFDDRNRPRSRAFIDTVWSESWDFLRESKG